MKNMRFFSTAAVALLASFLMGCAHYQTGSLMHPQIQTIGVGAVVNETDEPRLGRYAKEELPASIMADGSLRLVAPTEADCVVNSKIVSYRLRNIGEVQNRSRDEEQRTYRTSIYAVAVDVEYTLVLRGRETPLLPPRLVTGNAEFTELADFDVILNDGLRKATVDAAAKVVSNVTEAW